MSGCLPLGGMAKRPFVEPQTGPFGMKRQQMKKRGIWDIISGIRVITGAHLNDDASIKMARVRVRN